jgi:hypothetical protein
MEPWRDLDAHNGGVEAQNGAVVATWSQILITLMRNSIVSKVKTDQHQSKKSDLDMRSL